MEIKTSEIIKLRLRNQQLADAVLSSPSGLLSKLGGVQAQDYAGSKWALGIRWLLSLLAPRIIAGTALRHRQLELDDATLKRTNNILMRSLEGGKQLIRKELSEVFAREGIAAGGVRLSHILQRAGLDQLICFGVKRGNEFTYTLLDEWVPKALTYSRDEALAELAKRYFISRGPASPDDFIWWSGLTAGNAKTALDGAMPFLKKYTAGSRVYWAGKEESQTHVLGNTALLLPPFDEYLVAYKDRSSCIDPHLKQIIISINGIFYPVILVNGRVAGFWKRSFKKDTLMVEINPISPFKSSIERSVDAAAKRYARFLGRTLHRYENSPNKHTNL